MIVFLFDEEGYLIGQKTCQLSPRESTPEKPVYLVPRNSTEEPPPRATKGSRARFLDGQWTLEELPPEPEVPYWEKEIKNRMWLIEYDDGTRSISYQQSRPDEALFELSPGEEHEDVGDWDVIEGKGVLNTSRKSSRLAEELEERQKEEASRQRRSQKVSSLQSKLSEEGPVTLELLNEKIEALKELVLAHEGLVDLSEEVKAPIKDRN